MTQGQERDCSPAAAMMIERMQTHSDDFLYGGKLHLMPPDDSMSERDRVALKDAHDKYIKEPNLMVWVLNTLMKPDDPKEDERMPVAQRLMGPCQYDPNTDMYITASKARITSQMVDMHNRVEAQSSPANLLNKLFGRGS